MINGCNAAGLVHKGSKHYIHPTTTITFMHATLQTWLSVWLVPKLHAYHFCEWHGGCHVPLQHWAGNWHRDSKCRWTSAVVLCYPPGFAGRRKGIASNSRQPLAWLRPVSGVPWVSFRLDAWTCYILHRWPRSSADGNQHTQYALQIHVQSLVRWKSKLQPWSTRTRCYLWGYEHYSLLQLQHAWWHVGYPKMRA